jgi:hypothetical protein
MSTNTMVLLAGHALMFINFSWLWFYLPEPKSKPRFADTRLHPYIVVTFCASLALAAAMITAGYLSYFSNY